MAKKDIAVTTEEFKVKLVEISEMATLEYDYDGTFKYDGGSLQLLNRDIPFTDKSMMVHYKGVIKIGADMEQANVRLNAAGNKIIVTVPHSKILSHEINEDSYEILDKSNGLFNRVKIEDDTEFRKLQKEETEKELEGNIIFDKADANLEVQLVNFLSFGYPNMNIVVEFK